MRDRKAIQTLQATYWNSKTGWVNNPPSEDDFEYAVRAGVMFPSELLTHDDVIKRAKAALENSSKKKVVSAFISSLTSRRLELRSALGSYACGVSLPTHDKTDIKAISCQVCGSYTKGEIEDLNVLNFERYKFGGVRHLDPLYIALDLELLEADYVEEPSMEAINIFRSVIIELRNLTVNRLSAAPAALAPLLKSNKNEREGIVSILGYCGILKVPNYLPLYKQYTVASEREHSSYSKSDWPFPADLWRPEYGLNEEAIRFWFNDYIS